MAAGGGRSTAGTLGTLQASPVSTWLLLAGVVVALTWSQWDVWRSLWRVWATNPDYSGGKFVPLISMYMVWTRREGLKSLPVALSGWGIVVLAFGQLVRLAGIFLSYGSAEQYSLVISIIGIVLLGFGLRITWRLRWILLFLLLMIPLPRSIHGALALPLQNFATSSAVYGLELMGYLVGREGNVLRVGEGRTIAVAEACNGLRMLTAFVVIGVVIAFIAKRPKWQKVVLVLSSIPVAILANTLRLAATVMLYHHVNDSVAEGFFHDFAGLTMMPIAIAASAGLLALMKWIAAEPVAVQGPRPGPNRERTRPGTFAASRA